MKIDWKEFKYDFYMWAPRRIVRGFFWDVKHGVLNIIKWIPIVWKDRDYDYSFIEDMLRFKLRNMMHFFNGPDTHILNAYKYAEEIEEVLYLLDRVHDDNYIEEVSLGFFDKYLENDLEKTINEMTDEERKSNILIYNQAEILEKEDRTRAYQLLSERIKSWWD